MAVTVERASWHDPRVVAFRELMDAEIGPLYAELRPLVPRVIVDPVTVQATFVAMHEGRPVGTIAVKRSGAFTELKRLFVDPAGRRLGTARALLAAAEAEARRRGVQELFLQTGKHQPKAMALYEREGWAPVAPYGPFAEDTIISRCYVKPLVRPVIAERRAAGAAPTVVDWGDHDPAGEIAYVELDPADLVRAPHARDDDEQLAAWAARERAAAGADGVVFTSAH